MLFFELSLLLLVVWLNVCMSASSVCPNSCNGHGLCNKYSVCECADGYGGGDCSELKCPVSNAWADQAIDNNFAHQPAECSNKGICDRTSGLCSCQAGFTGTACERLECPSNCASNGECMSMYDFARTTRNSLSVNYDYSLVWDAHKIWGCQCNSAYRNYGCTWRKCPSGDDPLTKGQVNEVQLFRCTALSSSGTFYLFYNGVSSQAIPTNANVQMVTAALQSIPGIGALQVFFSLPTSPVCNSVQFNVVSVRFLDNMGPQNPLVPLLGSGFFGGIDISADGKTSLATSTGVTMTSVKGTTEDADCANRGSCSNTDGICSCYNTNGDAYGSSNGLGGKGTRGDCGAVISGVGSVATCPGSIGCNAQGYCTSGTFKCTCIDEFSSGDCSIRSCPTGRSWFSYPSGDNEAHDTYSQCSDMGICDQVSGVCNCRDGFFGEACQYMSCDGLSSAVPRCNGNGRCMSMSELALWANKNGDATEYTYGDNPNNAFTWDGKKIFGCYCDPGYFGYDCSLRMCPTGDDPGTYDDHVEVQLLRCTADTGTFQLSFRQALTPPIPYNATELDLKGILEKLSTITKISVYSTRQGLLYPDAIVGTGYTVAGTVPTTRPTVAPTLASPIAGTPTATPTATPTTQGPQGICTSSGSNIVIIVFDTVHGDLPALIPTTTALYNGISPGTVQIFADGRTATVSNFYGGSSPLTLTSIKGTTENAPCNNRGKCLTTTGICQCYAGWSSSDGEGNPGYRGDCGYRNQQLENF